MFKHGVKMLNLVSPWRHLQPKSELTAIWWQIIGRFPLYASLWVHEITSKGLFLNISDKNIYINFHWLSVIAAQSCLRRIVEGIVEGTHFHLCIICTLPYIPLKWMLSRLKRLMQDVAVCPHAKRKYWTQDISKKYWNCIDARSSKFFPT